LIVLVDVSAERVEDSKAQMRIALAKPSFGSSGMRRKAL
jgi:hypothetical protein